MLTIGSDFNQSYSAENGYHEQNAFPWNFSDTRVFDHLLTTNAYRGRRSKSKVMVYGSSYMHLNTSLFSLRVPKMGKKVNFYPFQGKGTVIWDYLRGVSFAAVSCGTCKELFPRDWYLACLQVVTDYQTFWQYAVFELFYGKGKVVRSSFMRIYFEGTSLSSSFRQRFSTIKRVGEFRLALNWQFDYIFLS